MLVPNRSVWISIAVKARTSSTLVREAKFLNASSLGLPLRISVVTSLSSSASAGCEIASSSLDLTMAWSRLDPASMQTMNRSSASGSPF